jgi:hypothetical protein
VPLVSNGRMIYKHWMYMEGSYRDTIEAVFQNFLGGTEENYRNPQSE